MSHRKDNRAGQAFALSAFAILTWAVCFVGVIGEASASQVDDLVGLDADGPTIDLKISVADASVSDGDGDSKPPSPASKPFISSSLDRTASASLRDSETSGPSHGPARYLIAPCHSPPGA